MKSYNLKATIFYLVLNMFENWTKTIYDLKQMKSVKCQFLLTHRIKE